VSRVAPHVWMCTSHVADPAHHINVLEFEAAARVIVTELKSSRCPPPGSYLTVVVDSAVASWWLANDAPRPGPALAAWRGLYAALADARVGLRVRLLPSHLQPADLPSRSQPRAVPFQHPDLDDARAQALVEASTPVSRRSAPPEPVIPLRF
jgi:hypothetical protein